MGFCIGRVESNTNDELDGKRIKVRIEADSRTTDIPDAFPLLPKIMHIIPKVGEAVIVFYPNDKPNEQRFYLGPITSQYQHMFKDYFDFGALKLIGGKGDADTAITNIPKTHGAFATNEDIAIYGRKNSDIILGDSDLRIRCGCHLVNKIDTTDIAFNKSNPSFIKLKYHENPVQVTKPKWMNDRFEKVPSGNLESSACIVAQEINLISTDSGNPYINTSNTDIKNRLSKNNGNEGISDEDLAKFIEEAHPLPYGDTLIKFLHIFIKAFENHTHRYHQMIPVQDETMKTLKSYPLNDILSKNVRIN